MSNTAPQVAEFTELLDIPSEASAAWDPFFFQIVDETPLYARVQFRDLALGVYLSGCHATRRKIGANLVEGWSDPGTINITPPGVEGIWEANASSRAVVVVIRPEFLARAIAEHWEADSQSVEIVKQFLIRDPIIETITLNLAREAEGGSPGGRLYAESSCEFLAHHLIYRYSSLSKAPPRSTGGLPSRRLKLVLEYIEDTLGQPIKLRELAALAGSVFVILSARSARAWDRRLMPMSRTGGCTERVSSWSTSRNCRLNRLRFDWDFLAAVIFHLRFVGGPGSHQPAFGRPGRSRRSTGRAKGRTLESGPFKGAVLKSAIQATNVRLGSWSCKNYAAKPM